MNTYFLSDTHFSHFNIIKHSCRPFSSAEEMDAILIENWNKLVKPNDSVYHLGDFAFCKLNELEEKLKMLNGNIHLILGNHDSMIEKNKSKLSKYFASIKNYNEIKIKDQKIILFHYGQRVWNKSHYGSFQLHGHSHGSLAPYGKSLDVGIDCKHLTSDYRPIEFEEIKVYMEKRSIKIVDHHE